MPRDLILTRAEKVPNYWSPYHRYTYSGANREVVIVDQLGGWNFNSDEPCMYMTATKDESGETPISKNLACSTVASLASDSHEKAEIIKFTVNGPVDNPAIIPDYYIKVLPHRYAIKATRGSVSESEVKDMALDFQTRKFSEIQASLAQRQL
jgi:hypothetical protein